MIGSAFELDEVKFFSKPFEYFTASSFFKNDVNTTLLKWFEESAPWTLVVKDFYEQYEFSFFDAELPGHIDFLTNSASLLDVKTRIEEVFGVRLAERVDFSAHKLVGGQTIRIHNDFIAGQESHRLVIQLNRGWNSKDGGLLLLFNSDDPKDVHKLVPPLNESCLGFRISPNSNHAVSTIHDAERYSVVYSFYV
jgi:Rps23 Pro-64 3,4-dihydroxylase Tpa1-like proline 4-hydroxylase